MTLRQVFTRGAMVAATLGLIGTARAGTDSPKKPVKTEARQRFAALLTSVKTSPKVKARNRDRPFGEGEPSRLWRRTPPEPSSGRDTDEPALEPRVIRS